MLSIGRRAMLLIGILAAMGTVSLGGNLIAGHISAQSGSTKTIYACVRDRIGVVVIRSEFEGCGTNWTPVEWNVQGPQGPTGEQGLRGAPGPAGANGLASPAGAIGPAGPPGSRGARGDQGQAGLQGSIGLAGPQGPWGDTGLAGSAGPTGPQGERGPGGPAGFVGLKGEAGNQGETGPAGSQGVPGPQGAAGPLGPPGLSEIEMISQVSSFNSSSKLAQISCPQGKSATGGGAFVSLGNIHVTFSQPLVSSGKAIGWRARAAEHTSTSSSWNFTVYAICAKVG